MFGNRSFLVKPVKDENVNLATPSEPVDYNHVVETIAKNAVIVIGAYFAGGTLREILVHVAKTGIQAK